jgi:hypothetical protein
VLSREWERFQGSGFEKTLMRRYAVFKHNRQNLKQPMNSMHVRALYCWCAATSPAPQLLPHNINQALLSCQMQVEVHHSTCTAQHLPIHNTQPQQQQH